MAYSSFGSRAPAFFIDMFVTFALTFIGSFLAIFIFGGPDSSDSTLNIVAWTASILIGWLYETCMITGPCQATIGKLVMGQKVVNSYGGRVEVVTATMRYFMSWVSSIFMLGYLMALWTRDTQTLHDKVSGCYVIDNYS